MNIDELRLWFGVTPIERRGSFVLVLIIFIIGVINLLIDDYYNPVSQLSEHEIVVIDSLLIAYEAASKKKDNYVRSHESKQALTPRHYDPNTVTHQELIAMGVPKRTATIWMNFRDKGGRFSKPTDIQNVYTLETEIFQTLLPYTTIAPPARKSKTKKQVEIQATKIVQPKALFVFDPNTISEDSLELLNIPPRLASSIIGYRKAGGTFRSVEKLKSSPGMTDSIYDVISTYVTIDSIYQHNKERWKAVASPAGKGVKKLVNLNTADSSELVLIKGIGPVRAKVLLERRENIGGFYHLDQLYDGLYSLDSAAVEQISAYLYVDDSYNRIYLQSSEIHTLRRHYYFSNNMAKTAINYFKHRDQRLKLDDFITNSPLLRENWEKVRPYLTLED